MQDAVADQTARLAEEFERSRQAAEEQAIEMQMAMAQAAEDHERALAQAAEEHKRTTANAWKLQSHSKSEQAYSLLQSGMLDEALQLAHEAIRQDPGNIDGFFVIGACLKARGKTEEARPYLIKQIQILKMPQYRAEVKFHRQVLNAVGADTLLLDAFCEVLEENVDSWSPCESVERGEVLVRALIDHQKYRAALLVQGWILQSFGSDSEALVATRKLICMLSSLPGGVVRWRMEVEAIAKHLALLGNRSETRGFSKGRSLVVTAFAEDIYSQLGIEKKLVAEYFREIKLANRLALDQDLGILKSMYAGQVIGAEVFSQVMSAARSKYAEWDPEIRSEIYNAAVLRAANQPIRKLGCFVGVVSFVLFQVSGSIIRQLTGEGNPSWESVPVTIFGGLLGAILLSVLSHRILKSFQRYNGVRSNLAEAVTGTNATREQIGIPALSEQEFRVQSPKIVLGVSAVLLGAFLTGWPIAIWKANESSRDSAEARAQLYNGRGLQDDLEGRSLGNTYGIHWKSLIGNRGAIFRAADSSRIEYPGAIPAEGTVELWIKVDSGYTYSNYAFKPNLNHATVFSTDVDGGDVTWPGAMRFTVSKNGDVSLQMATNKYDQPSTVPTVAKGTGFSFGKWHAIGISYGRQGQAIMVDGKVVASAPGKTQRLGGGGTDVAPVDVPTIGETVSHAWQPRRYNGGFEGMVAGFRASTAQQDWNLAKGIPDLTRSDLEQNSGATTTNVNTPQSDAVPSSPMLVVSSEEMESRKVEGTYPPYPPIARAARVGGAVVLHAIISKTGTVAELSIVSGPALLQQAALDAVKKWRYNPYLVNGIPTEVQTDITLTFDYDG
jgi:TonB family protein